MEQFFNYLIETATAAPHMAFISLAFAIVFIIGGIVLYRNRGRFAFLKGKRWPGTVCSLLGCASLVTTAVQYLV